MTRAWLASALLACLTLLAGCGDQAGDAAVAQRAVAIEHGDECHLCGMVIQEQSGPKGELYEKGTDQVRKFCSTRDLFAYLLDPERNHRIETVWVHDMAVAPWDNPGQETFVNAREAWFVVGSRRRGAMGPTLASFAEQRHARAFAEQYGGRLYRFDAIDLALLSQMR